MSSEVYDFSMQFVVTYNADASIAVDKCVAYIKGCATVVTFALEVGVGNIIACT